MTGNGRSVELCSHYTRRHWHAYFRDPVGERGDPEFLHMMARMSPGAPIGVETLYAAAGPTIGTGVPNNAGGARRSLSISVGALRTVRNAG